MSRTSSRVSIALWTRSRRMSAVRSVTGRSTTTIATRLPTVACGRRARETGTITRTSCGSMCAVDLPLADRRRRRQRARRRSRSRRACALRSFASWSEPCPIAKRRGSRSSRSAARPAHDCSSEVAKLVASRASAATPRTVRAGSRTASTMPRAVSMPSRMRSRIGARTACRARSARASGRTVRPAARPAASPASRPAARRAGRRRRCRPTGSGASSTGRRTVALEAGDQPHLPERTCPAQRLREDASDELQERVLGRLGERDVLQVRVQVEVLVVDPRRTVGAERHRPEALPEPRDERQPALEHRAQLVVRRRRALVDREGRDVHGRARSLEVQEARVERREAVHAARPRGMLVRKAMRSSISGSSSTGSMSRGSTNPAPTAHAGTRDRSPDPEECSQFLVWVMVIVNLLGCIGAVPRRNGCATRT